MDNLIKEDEKIQLMKPASAKQIEYAEKIAKTLSIPLPQTKSSYEYWKFIHDNKSKFHSKIMNTGYCPDEEGFLYSIYPADIELAYN